MLQGGRPIHRLWERLFDSKAAQLALGHSVRDLPQRFEAATRLLVITRSRQTIGAQPAAERGHAPLAERSEALHLEEPEPAVQASALAETPPSGHRGSLNPLLVENLGTRTGGGRHVVLSPSGQEAAQAQYSSVGGGG